MNKATVDPDTDNATQTTASPGTCWMLARHEAPLRLTDNYFFI